MTRDDAVVDDVNVGVLLVGWRITHGVRGPVVVGGRYAVGVGVQFSVCLALGGVVVVLKLALMARYWCGCHCLWSCCGASSSVGVVVAAMVIFAVVAEVVAVVVVACSSEGRRVVPVTSSVVVVGAFASPPFGRSGGLAKAPSGGRVDEWDEWLVEVAVVRDAALGGGGVGPAALGAD